MKTILSIAFLSIILTGQNLNAATCEADCGVKCSGDFCVGTENAVSCLRGGKITTLQCPKSVAGI